MPKEIDNSKISWNWKNYLLLFLAIIFVAGLALGGFEYLNGRFDYYYSVLVVFLIFPTLLLLHIIEVPLYIFQLIKSWHRFSLTKRIVVIIQNIVVTYFLICFFTGTGLWIPGVIAFSYGFRSHIIAETNVSQIQNWLKTFDPNLCDSKDKDILSRDNFETSDWPKDVNWPNSITIFNPHYVCLDLDENNSPKIRLTWGGVFGHWGIEIGSEKMAIPPTKKRKLEEYNLDGTKGTLWISGEFRLPMAPGAYVWHELR
jgi:hypothetical protein